eukprot:gnl/Dysnectes_brevis/6323_a9734_321.p1 GENE.gnl/Dysnectes_brevis/6323_a9734_321~~gnl/Dysnectes_brevis/6323_a9734_321.p1  ORF type:complete len:455 (-),score=146.05 gnl/Dysnectes_brevis/6323_a9734_321:32-1396(-)
MIITLLSLVLVVLASIPKPVQYGSSSILYEWNYLDFTFETEAEHDSYIENQIYKNLFLAGVQKNSQTGDIFVSAPRWGDSIPATLAKLVPNPDNPMAPLLSPFPSWAANTPGDDDLTPESTLHSVLGFEINPYTGDLWVLDQGKINSVTGTPNSVKLIIYDSEGNTIDTIIFPEEVADLSDSFLNDIVLDLRDLDSPIAYISDSGISVDPAKPANGAIIVVENGVPRRFLQDDVSTMANASFVLDVRDAPLFMQTGTDGIALSPDGSQLVWCPLTSRTLYTAPTSQFLGADANPQPTKLIDRPSAADGLAFGADGSLFMTGIENNAIMRLGHGEAEFDTLTTVTSDDERMVWPDGMAFDGTTMLLVSNSLDQFDGGFMDFTVTNFRIWEVEVGTAGYLDRLYDVTVPESDAGGVAWWWVLLAGVGGVVIGLVTMLLVGRKKSDEYVPLTAETPL